MGRDATAQDLQVIHIHLQQQREVRCGAPGFACRIRHTYLVPAVHPREYCFTFTLKESIVLGVPSMLLLSTSNCGQ